MLIFEDNKKRFDGFQFTVVISVAYKDRSKRRAMTATGDEEGVMAKRKLRPTWVGGTPLPSDECDIQGID